MRYLILAVSILVAQSAQAEIRCTFTSECMSGEACAETTFALSYRTAECENDRLPITASTDFGDLSGTSLVPCVDANAFGLKGDGASYLLSLHDGAAQLTTHMDGPMAITYTGTCEAKN